MGRNYITILFILFASQVFAQCDVLGGLLELQFTTNYDALLRGDGQCLKPTTVTGGLVLTGGELKIIEGDTIGQVLTWDGGGWIPQTIIRDTFFNGLNRSGRNVKLGGTLVQNTTIDGVKTYDFVLSNMRRINFEAERTSGAAYTTMQLGSTDIDGFDLFHINTSSPTYFGYLRVNSTTGNILRLQSATNVQTEVNQYWDGASHVTDIGSTDGVDGKTLRITKTGMFAFSLDKVDEFSSPGIMMYDTFTNEIRYQSPDILLTGGNKPDSTFIRTGGQYWGKQTHSAVYRTGKTGFGTADTTAQINIKPKNPVGSARTYSKIITAPNRGAFSAAAFSNASYLDIEKISIDPMKPAHYPSFVFPPFIDRVSIDSSTNLAAGRPGNAIRNEGFNMDGENASLAKFYLSTEQHYLPVGSNNAAWERHIEVFDTLGRQARPFNLFGTHNGNLYTGGFRVNSFYVGKPFQTDYGILMDFGTNVWRTDYPFSFRINNQTRPGPIIERLHGASYLNVLDWTPSGGRTTVGASGGIIFDNRCLINYSLGSTPKILSASGNLRFDSTELYIKSTGGRHIRFESYGTSDYLDFGFDNNYFFINKSSTTQPFSIHKNARDFSFRVTSSGKTAFGSSAAFFDVDIFASTNSLGGSLGLRNEAQGWISLKSDANKNFEIRNDQGSTRFHFLTSSPNSSRTGTLADIAFVSDGTNASFWGKRTGTNTNTGWAEFISSNGSGTSGQVAFFSSSNNVVGDANLFWDNTNKRLGVGYTTPFSRLEVSGNIGAYSGSGSSLYLGDDNFRNASYFDKAPGLTAIFNASQGITSDLGIYAYNGSRLLVAKATAEGRFGVGTTSPAQKLHVEGTARITGSDGEGTAVMLRDADGDISNATLDGLQIVGGTLSQAYDNNEYGNGTHTWNPSYIHVYANADVGNVTLNLSSPFSEGRDYFVAAVNNGTNTVTLSGTLYVDGVGSVSTYTLGAWEQVTIRYRDAWSAYFIDK